MAQNPSSLPESIGRFRIEARLGSGGMGDVYRGVDPTLKRSVAVKTVRPGLGGQEYVDRLYREAQACAALQHPNIVTIYEVGEFDGGVFIAMEYLKGHNLATVVEHGALSLASRLTVLTQILDALAHAHDEQVIHRDIKPSNVHLLPDGSIKLLDFGLARMEAAETITLSGAVMGTPHYASPEQLRAERVDARSDIFSTGAMAYELFEGRRPFEGDTISAILIKVLTEPAPAAGGEWSRRVPLLEQIVQRAMAKNPAERFQTAREMRDAIAAVASKEREAVAAYDAEHPPQRLPALSAPPTGSSTTAPTVDRRPMARPAESQTTNRLAAAADAPTAVTVPAHPSAHPVAVSAASREDERASPRASRRQRRLLVALAVIVIGFGVRSYRQSVRPNPAAPATAGVEAGVPQAVTPAASDTAANTNVAAALPPPPGPVQPFEVNRTVTAPGATIAPAVVAATAVPLPADAPPIATGPGQAKQLFSAAAGTVQNAGLKWRVIRKLDSGEEVDADGDQTFHSGDRVRLAFESNINGFLYVAHQGSSRRWTLLFPGETINGGSNAIARGQLTQVPDNGWFRFDDTPGQEELFVVLSRERLADMPGFQGRVRRSDSLPPKAVDDLRLRLASRDLVFEKDTPSPARSTATASLAQYVVNRDELGKAVSATITLKHAR